MPIIEDDRRESLSFYQQNYNDTEKYVQIFHELENGDSSEVSSISHR